MSTTKVPPNYYQTTQVTQPKTKGPDYKSTKVPLTECKATLAIPIGIGIGFDICESTINKNTTCTARVLPIYHQTTQVTQPKTKGPDYQSTKVPLSECKVRIFVLAIRIGIWHLANKNTYTRIGIGIGIGRVTEAKVKCQLPAFMLQLLKDVGVDRD